MDTESGPLGLTFPERLWKVVVHSHLYRDSAFAKLASQEKAADLLNLASRGESSTTAITCG